VAQQVDRWRRYGAEALGTAFLLIAVVGSGIMAQRLSPNDVGLQLLEAALATGFALMALILALGPVSGAHLNPAVTLADRFLGGISTRDTVGYIVAQIGGGLIGTIVANLMFELDAVTWSTTGRAGAGTFLGEAIATLGLLFVIFGIVRAGESVMVAVAVGAYIAGAYFFTSSTSFANPAVTVARTITDTFAGIEPASVPWFVLAQLFAVVVGTALVAWLFPGVREVAEDVVLPHPHD
jgi:arsenate reductase